MSPPKKKSTAVKTKKVKTGPKRKSSVKAASSRPPRPKIATFSPELRVYPTASLLYEETAPFVMKVAREAADARGRFVWALSGGTTPKGLFQQLAEEPYLSLMPWAKTYVFWVDERHVPLTDESSNYRLAQDFLLSKAPIPKTNIFPMSDGSQPVDRAASIYEIRLGKFFGTGALPRFDLALMGMGEDGHTASLFPGMPQVNELDKWVVGYFVDEAKKERVSLTFPVLNASRTLLVMMEGQKKAERVRDVLEGAKDPPRYPVQYLRPTDGELIFAMDAAAASLLKKS
ncbi:MAG TPA: 6-phosphogluconolactonase [bacterium]|nr:6-phosphogluconolactonase [bacterium]